MRIPLVLCSSKTRAEIESYRKLLENTDPFISENGGGLFIPRGYFSFHAPGEKRGDYMVLELGAPYHELRKTFVRLRERLGVSVKGFGDMTPGKIAALTGLAIEQAALAKEREFDEPFFFQGRSDFQFLSAIEKEGLRWTKGRFFHLMGNSDKGQAVRILKKFYEKSNERIISIGIGDSFNDLPLLQATDHAVLIRKENGAFDPNVRMPKLIKTERTGAAGWNQAIIRFLWKNRETAFAKPAADRFL